MAWSNRLVPPQKIDVAHAVATAAKTTYNDATNAVLLYTAPPEGGLLVRLTALARATLTDTQLQSYSSTDGGVTLNLVKTRRMPGATMSQTTEFPETDFGYSEAIGTRRMLAPGEKLYVAIGVALGAGVVFRAEVQTFTLAAA